MESMIKATQNDGKTTEEGGNMDITDVVEVASYNWMENEDPVMFVPGIPAAWSPPMVEQRLPPDRGRRYIDQNAGRSPKSPMEPLVIAVLHQHPDFDFGDIDLITDRWALNQLLLDGDTRNEDGSGFTFFAQVVGDTVVFVRKEKETMDTVGTTKANFRGFRDNFDKEHLEFRTDCLGSVSHHGIISYRLGGIHIMLRHKVNGYLPEKAPEALLSLLSLEEDAATTAKQVESEITVISRGYTVPKSALLELSTAKMVNTMAKYRFKEVPEQWLSQTPTFVRAVLQYGWHDNVPIEDLRATVKRIDIRDAAKDVASWVDRKQLVIKRFHERLSALLQDLRSLSADGEGTYIVKRAAMPGYLDIERVSAMNVPVLTKEVCERLTKNKPHAQGERGSEQAATAYERVRAKRQKVSD